MVLRFFQVLFESFGDFISESVYLLIFLGPLVDLFPDHWELRRCAKAWKDQVRLIESNQEISSLLESFRSVLLHTPHIRNVSRRYRLFHLNFFSPNKAGGDKHALQDQNQRYSRSFRCSSAGSGVSSQARSMKDQTPQNRVNGTV